MADNDKTTIVIDPGLPPLIKHSDMFEWQQLLNLACQSLPVVNPFLFGRTAKASYPAAQQTLQPLTVWALALILTNRTQFYSNTQRVIELNICTVYMKNKSDLEHAQLTCGPDSGPRLCICQILFSPFPSPLFCPRTAKTRSGDEIVDGARS